jgi:hypothetical protein
MTDEMDKLKLDVSVFGQGAMFISADGERVNHVPLTDVFDWDKDGTACLNGEIIADKPLSFDALKEAIVAMPKDPLAEWMRDKGFNPNNGCKLILPEFMRDVAGKLPPDYMLFSEYVDSPLLVDPSGEADRKRKIEWGADYGFRISDQSIVRISNA